MTEVPGNDSAYEFDQLRARSAWHRLGDVDDEHRREEAQLLGQVRRYLDSTQTRASVLARAQALESVVLAFYDHAKFREVGGEGLDGRDGPERRGVGLVSDAARSWANEVRDRRAHPPTELGDRP